MSGWDAPEVVAAKKAFAKALLQFNTPFEASSYLFPGSENIGKALQIAQHWPADPIVIAEMETLIGELGEETFLPSKSKLAKAVWALATEGNRTAEDRIKSFELYGKIMGFIEKPGGGKDNQTQPPDIIIGEHPDDIAAREKAKSDA